MVPSQNYNSVARRPPDIEDYIDMFRRYRSWILGPTFAGLVVAVVVAFFWPDTYVSTAVMRITPQRVPERLVPSTVTSQIAERLQALQQEIVSRGSLEELIKRPELNLYRRERDRKPMEDVVDEMRKNIKINILDLPNPQMRIRGASAFQISFSYYERHKAQAVVSALVTKFSDQNANELSAQAKITTDFLTTELRLAKENLDQLSSQITSFKTANQGRLPEQLQTNMQTLNALQMQLAAANEAINRNSAEKLMLETQLQNLRNSAALVTTTMEEVGPSAAVKNERLMQLDKTILEAELKLAASREFYKDDHPDIRGLKKTLEVLKRERDSLEAARQRQDSAAAAALPKLNPQAARALEDIKSQIANVQAQIQAKDHDIQQRTKNVADLNKSIQAYQGRIDVSPVNEQTYQDLRRDFEIAKTKYEEMARKKELSDTAQNLEERKIGENLEVLDSASLPEAPSEPNRLVIAGTGTGLGFFLGLFLSGMREMKDASLKNLKDVRAYTNLPVLSSIPLLENALQVRRKRRLFWLAWSSAVVVGALAISGSMYYYYFGRG
jgi:uncharacterized protein involved in exopolysaccharide biosynthesis